MPRVMLSNFSTFYDTITRTQFDPVLDKRTGCFVAVAEVDDAQAATFAERPAYRVIDDAEWLAMTTRRPAPEPTQPLTGNPLTDAASEVAGESLLAPPKPPRSR